MSQIKTDRLLLRRAIAADVPQLWDVFRRPEAMKYWSELPHATPKRTEEFVQGMMAMEPDAPYYTVEFNGEAIGTAGFWKNNEVGFILHPKAWRQGLGRELLGALVPHGFERCGFDQIIADVDPGNDASIGLLTGLGFEEIGREKATLQLGDVWVDSVFFGLTRQRWEDGS